MARTRRHWSPGKGHHLISRFVDRRFCLTSQRDRDRYLRDYGAAQPRWDWRTLSFALMSSHIHLGLVGGHAPIEGVFRSVHARAAWSFHEKRDTLGPVLAGRPKLYEVPDEALPRLVAYHHRNPVSAGVVTRAKDSRWTSHRAYLRLTPAPPWLDVERNLALFGFSDNERGRAAFDEFVNEIDLEQEIPRAPNGGAHRLTERRAPLTDEQWGRLLHEASRIVGCSVDALIQSRSHRSSDGRRLVARVARHDFHQTYDVIAQRLNRSVPSTHRLANQTPKNVEQVESHVETLRERLRLGQGEA